MTPISCSNAPSTARYFYQLAKRGYTTTTAAQAQAPLEFLLPRCVPQPAPRANITASAAKASALPRRSSLGRRSWHSPTQIAASRHFSTSPRRLRTQAIVNPATDEDGNEMILEITPSAGERLSEIMKKDQNPNLALRIQVESGGCHGFQYLMSLVTLPAKDSQEWSSVVNEDDTVFQFTPDDVDPATTSEGPKIILDEPSLDLLKGSKVDFTKALIGSQFKIIDNPFATSSCGCGTSFDIKM